MEDHAMAAVMPTVKPEKLGLFDEGLGLLGDFMDFSSESDGADSGVSTPEVFSPLHESFFFEDDLSAPTLAFNDLLKPFLGAVPSLPELPQLPGDLLNFPLDDLCTQLDATDEFIGLHVDDATSILSDLVLEPAWDPKLLAQTASILLLSPPTALPATTDAFATSSSISPSLVDNVQQQSSEDEDDEIDVVTVDDAADALQATHIKSEPQATVLTAPASPLLQPPAPSTPPAAPAINVTLTTATAPDLTASLSTALPPTLMSTAAAQLQGLPPLTSLPPHMSNNTSSGLPPLMSFPGAASFGASSNAANGRSASPNAGNKYHPYAFHSSSVSSSAHTPKRNTERKRQLHNELERKRREDLNNVFNALGEVIPDLHNTSNGNGNVSQGTPSKSGSPTQTQILQGATDYLRHLKETHAELTRQREEEVANQAALKARLAELMASRA